MKKILLLIIVITPALVIFHLAYRASRSQVGSVDRHKIAQSRQQYWMQSESLSIPEINVSNLINGCETNFVLSSQQEQALAKVLTAWFDMLHSGTFQSFLAFRKPDEYKFDPDVLNFVASRLHIDSLNGLSNQQKLQMLHDYFNRITFDTVQASSVELRKIVTTQTNSAINPFNYYPEGLLLLHRSSPCQYKTEPKDFLREGKSVEWICFSAAYKSEHRPGDAIPLQIVFFWNPDESDWFPYECYMTSMPVQQGEKTPTIFF